MLHFFPCISEEKIHAFIQYFVSNSCSYNINNVICCKLLFKGLRYTVQSLYNAMFGAIGMDCITVKPVLSGHSKRRPKIVFQDRLSLNAGQKYCRMLQESILQYFRPSLSYNLSLRPLFCLFLSGYLRPVLLYNCITGPQHELVLSKSVL